MADTSAPACSGWRMSVLETMVLVAVVAVGLGSNRLFGPVVKFAEGPGQPRYWPWLWWANEAHAPLMLAAPCLLLCCEISDAVNNRSGRFSILSWIWLVNSVVWIPVLVPVWGSLILYLLLVVQSAITLVGIVVLIAFLIAPELRRRLSWVDALAVFSVAAFDINILIWCEVKLF